MPLKGLAERLRAARAASALTQVQVAEHLGFSPLTIANWERARSEPGVGELSKLVVLYEVTADWLLTGHERLPHRFETLKVHRCRHLVPLSERCTRCEESRVVS